ncbi:hypothetical protein COEREDRAFT_86700 [Coemansia reversa NRRL 1564]|uniref:Uncharacterized protein n=1 Tax=Coemansia reversa (strain ATCC 12441 / NRRL 1564) TaxID=763665 RepID=A0A2G5BD68_COERN|nr:hypothetical protein COEREDRAFT_86700 [Coemansia reversa NRRL 1564]|eukprot:PIA16951.1 hypothetical protein COEREDRAFT_86700 [Coemansia reversa NRRL 1564]
MSHTEPVESEAQKRRRLRQERILNRGNDRLGRIRSTLSQTQDELSTSEMSMVGGHELKTAETTTHVAGISLDSVENTATDSRPRRRAGNLARAARLKAEAAMDQQPFSNTNVGSGSGEKDIRQAINTANINSNALHDTVTAEIADPVANVPSQLETSTSFASPTGGVQPPGNIVMVRRFSVAGLLQSVVRLMPVLSVFVYGIRREAGYERLMGDSEADVRSKWANLLESRPDSRLDEWASGNFLLWYVMIVEAVLYGTYLVLTDRRPQTSNALLANIPGIPGWTSVIFSAGGRILDSIALLLFLTALCIVTV